MDQHRNKPMNYEYDIFISYSRNTVTGSVWVTDYFLPLFEDYLSLETGFKPKIFIDKNDIQGGEKWKNKISLALARSKYLLSIWTPLYFTSEWCCRELAVMLERSKALNYHTHTHPAGLVIPVNAWDGEIFPDRVKDIQCFKHSDYVYPSPAFHGTEKYLDFQNEMRKLTKEVAKLINIAPNWSPEWDQVNWMDTDISELRIGEPDIEKPSMS